MLHTMTCICALAMKAISEQKPVEARLSKLNTETGSLQRKLVSQ